MTETIRPVVTLRQNLVLISVKNSALKTHAWYCDKGCHPHFFEQASVTLTLIIVIRNYIIKRKMSLLDVNLIVFYASASIRTVC